MEPSPQTATPVALSVTRNGDLVALTAGQRLDEQLLWQARVGKAQLGERLLRLTLAPDGALAPDLAFGRDLARAVLEAFAAAPTSAERIRPAPGQIAALLAAAPASADLSGLDEPALLAAWRQVADVAERELRRAGSDRDEFLRDRGVDPAVGRIHLHIAELDHPSHPFGFLATIVRGRDDRGHLEHVPLGAAMTSRAGDSHAQLRMILPLAQAAGRDATVRALLDSQEIYHAVAWTAAEAHALLRATPALTAVGVQVHAPEWWFEAPQAPQVRVELGAAAPSSLGIGALLDFQLRYFIGDDELTAAEWRELVRGAAGLHRLRGRWAFFDPKHHAEALRQWDGVEAAAAKGGVGFGEGMRLLAGLPREPQAEPASATWTVTRPGPWLERTLAALQSPTGSAEADPGPALRGELRPYQRDGVAWLWLLLRLGLGGCLADDMGLGKTLQVIALLLLMRANGYPGPHLIVLPASLLGNWRAELERFAPDLRVHVAHRSAGDIDTPPALDPETIVLTTYATLTRQPWLQERPWGLVALDEAQAIKNAQAKQTRAVKALRSRHRLVLTGTPVENSLADLWSLFDFCCPGLLGQSADFKSFSKRLGSDRAGLVPLRTLVRPYILRRLKTDRRVIADLPDKVELQVYCGLTRIQAALYAQAVEALAREVALAQGMQRRGVILAYLTRFKQICNHPSHFTGDGLYQPTDSAKFQRLQELCAPIAEAGEKLLVFTQFREICGPLATLLAGCFGRPGLVLHGGTPVERRAEIVAAFQRDPTPDQPGPPFMVLSLKAGGTGLNLTAAGHVVHFDRWWNPAVENQATDRAYRIGQHRNVLVHKFVCRGTLEERIDAMLTRKQGLADGVLADDGERRLTELDTAELMRVVSLDLRAALVED